MFKVWQVLIIGAVLQCVASHVPFLNRQNLRESENNLLIAATNDDAAFAQSERNKRKNNDNNDDNSGEESSDYFTTTRDGRGYCPQEEFCHFALGVGEVKNAWNRTAAGRRGGLKHLCLFRNGLPLTRRCRFDRRAHRAIWEDIRHWPRVECLLRTRERTISADLNTLYDNLETGSFWRRGLTGRNGTRQLFDMLATRDHKVLPADIHLSVQVLGTLTEGQSEVLSQDVVSICSTLMATDPQVLRISADLNATNALLDTFETYMDALGESFVPQTRCGARPSGTMGLAATVTTNSRGGPSSAAGMHATSGVDYSYMGVHAELSANLSVFYVNPACANISGIAVFDRMDAAAVAATGLWHESHGDFHYRFVYMNESLEALRREQGLQVAAFVPPRLWQHVERIVRGHGRQPLLVLKVYASDVLFVDAQLVRNRQPDGKVLSISIPGYAGAGAFPEDLPFLLRNEHLRQRKMDAIALGTGCGYWNYSTWVSDGVRTNPAGSGLQDPVIECVTRHLTQFSFLIGGSYRQTDPGNGAFITPFDERVLDIISIVGCSLSLVGLSGIWMTAALFRSWRSLASTKVLLNLCVALTLQMVLFVFVNTDDMSQHLVDLHIYVPCVILGALMQYSILVVFSWMLIIAFLQFQRYVTVIGIARPSHYILKAAVVAWSVPLIPTLLVACIDPDSYLPSAYQLSSDTGVCYPSGFGLILGVVVPVVLIVMANLTIFVYVFYSISHSLGQSMQRQEKQMVVKQIRLSVLLFFLLGLSWIFGIFAFMHAGIVFSYLFCLTATLQGFVLFVYFVLLDEMTRDAWLQLLCPSRRKEPTKKPAEMQSMTTTSTSTAVTSSVRGESAMMNGVKADNHD